jgi:hypothetical protein
MTTMIRRLEESRRTPAFLDVEAMRPSTMQARRSVSQAERAWWRISTDLCRKSTCLPPLGFLALVALALAITGIYAVVMYSASQRMREIGIRVALGASRANIVRLVMGHGNRFVLIGLVMGIAMAVGATRLLSTTLFGVAATDAVTFGPIATFCSETSNRSARVTHATITFLAWPGLLPYGREEISVGKAHESFARLQAERDGRAASRLTISLDISSMRRDQIARDGQAEPGSP